MRCCASYRISFHLYQSGLLGRVPQPVFSSRSLNRRVRTEGIAAGAGDNHSSLSARRRNSSGTERTTRNADP